MGIPNIIKLLTPLVNPLSGIFRSKLFYIVIGSILLLLVLTKFDFSKVVKILKLLGKMGVSVLSLFFGVALSPFVKMFQEAEEMRG